MYGSADIIDYLYRSYAGRPAPTRCSDHSTFPVRTGLDPGSAGARVRPSRAPEAPLELFSFESSPYSRRVRALLCELELPLLRSTGQASGGLGPPILRATLFPELPVRGRTRTELLERAGEAISLPGTSEHWQSAIRVGSGPRLPGSHIRQVTHSSMHARPGLTDPPAREIS